MLVERKQREAYMKERGNDKPKREKTKTLCCLKLMK